MIIGKPTLQDVRTTITAGTAPVTIQLPDMHRASPHMWRGNRVTNEKSELSTAANYILAGEDEVPLRAAELENHCNSVADFTALFPQEIPRELPPLRKINHNRNIITGSS